MKWKNQFNFLKLIFTLKIYVLILKVKVNKLQKLCRNVISKYEVEEGKFEKVK